MLNAFSELTNGQFEFKICRSTVEEENTDKIKSMGKATRKSDIDKISQMCQILSCYGDNRTIRWRTEIASHQIQETLSVSAGEMLH